MTVEWICNSCNKSYQHPTFVIQHITKAHLGGSAQFMDMARMITVKADTEPEAD